MYVVQQRCRARGLHSHPGAAACTPRAEATSRPRALTALIVKGAELDTEDRIGFTWAEVIGDRLGRVFIGTARTLLADERL